MKDGPAFQMYAADFLIDTNTWSATQVGIYLRLLLTEWVNGSIPNDTEKLARIAQVDHGNFRKCWCPTVEGKFTPNGDGNLINRRLEEVREKQRKYKESQSIKGKHSAELRHHSEVTRVITDFPPLYQPEGNSSSSSSKDINNNTNVHNSKNVENLKKYYKNEMGNYVCQTCSKTFMQWKNLQDHFQEHKEKTLTKEGF